MKSFSYSDRLRVRACGILNKGGEVLLVQLHSPVTDSLIWTPPGGGVEPGESLKQTVQREFKEETGLSVQVGDVLHINELIESPFHAVEFYFEVQKESGELRKGMDPEHADAHQLIQSVAFMGRRAIQKKNVVPSFLKEEYWDEKRKGFTVFLREE
ncbi:MAG: NUDIX hydrolase [Balneolaceae bacterium]|nr:NUDIX hydrolase [Balneolaceae bacterium]